MNKYLLRSFTLLSDSGNTLRFLIIGILLSILLSPGNLFVDAEKRLQVSRWIWTDQPQVLADDSQFLNHLPGRNGETMAQFGVGQSLVMLPADIVSGLMLGIEMTPQKMKLREMIVYYLTFPLITGLALLYARRLTGCFLGNSRHADLATLAFALCTSFLVYARDTQENMLMNLCVLGGIYHGLQWSRNGLALSAAIAATFLGFLILIRVSTITVIAPLVLALGISALLHLWQQKRKDLIVGIAVIGSILFAFVLLDRAYHWYRFGEFTRTYAYYMIEQAKLHGHGNNYPMGNDFWSGIRSFAFDPRKAAFLFDPLLLIAVAMVFVRSRREPVIQILIAASLVSLVLTACIYAKSDFWHGDTSWGPRHLHIAIMPTVFFGIIATFDFLMTRKHASTLWIFRLTLILGFSIQAISLPLYHELEVDQWKAGHSVSSPPILRVMNFVSKVSNDPNLWNLDCNHERVRSLQQLPLQFAPFQIAHKMPGSAVAKLLIAAWLVALLACLVGLGFWIRQLTRTGARI